MKQMIPALNRINAPLVGLFAIIIGTVALWSKYGDGWAARGMIVCTQTRVGADLETLKALMQEFREIYGEYPSGDSDTIFRALAGDNPRKIKFMGTPNGELLDPWGTRYQFYQTEGTPTLGIRSAGRDRRFGTWDDKIARFDSH